MQLSLYNGGAVILPSTFSLIVICSFLLPSASASTIGVPADQPTIQAAIDAARNGDVILVSPGTYPEQINFSGKAIAVESASGSKNTVIDGGGEGSVVTFSSGETSAAVLRGFTIQNGTGTVSFGNTEGGGIEISGSSPTILENLVTNNEACDGGGIAITNGGSPLISRNAILRNSGGDCGGLGGGGIAIHGAGAPRIIGNDVSENSECCANGGGIYVNYTTGVALIFDNRIYENSSGGSGGGLYVANQGDVNVIQNLISSNSAGLGAGIYWAVPDNSTGPLLVNNTIADNLIVQSCPDCVRSEVYILVFTRTACFSTICLSVYRAKPFFIAIPPTARPHRPLTLTTLTAREVPGLPVPAHR